VEYLIVFVAAVFVVLWGISIYFIKTGRMKASDWSKRSMGLPRGTVRALLALIILFMLVSSILTDMKLPDLPEWLVGILGTIIGFYFGAAMAAPPSQTPDQDEGKAPKPQ